MPVVRLVTVSDEAARIATYQSVDRQNSLERHVRQNVSERHEHGGHGEEEHEERSRY